MQSEISSSPTTKQLQNHKWEILHCSIIFTAGDNSNRRSWFFDVTVSSCPAFLSDCQKWILNNSTEGFEHDTCSADYCPPSEDFAIAFGWPCLTRDPAFPVRTCYRPFRRIFSSTGSFRYRDLGVAQSVGLLLLHFNILLSIHC